MANLVAVHKLVEGDVLSSTVNTDTGKVLLGKDVILTARHISLLNNWDIQRVWIQADEEENNESLQHTVQTFNSAQYIQFVQEYDLIVEKTAQSFDIIRKTRIIPISNLKDTAENIHESIVDNSFEMLKYLFISGSKLVDFIPRHSVMVAYFAGIIARQMKWSEKDIAGVALTSLLHDVGNLVTDKIEDSRKQVHIAETASLLKTVRGLPSEVILGIVQHRERMNSSGFPTGAPGSQIHPYAKIIAIADTFHNLAYTDEYANPFPMLDMLTRDMYDKFDTEICQNFIFRVRDSLLFNKILLSNGQAAEVIFFNPEGYSTPVVKTADHQIIDLAKRRDLMIKQIVIPT